MSILDKLHVKITHNRKKNFKNILNFSQKLKLINFLVFVEILLFIFSKS